MPPTRSGFLARACLRVIASLWLAGAVVGGVGDATAEPAKRSGAARTKPVRETTEEPWSTGTLAAKQVAAGQPLVIRLFVPLCSNDQIDCGSSLAGKAGDLEHNLYWGAVFGVRHFFDRKNSGWERVVVDQGKLEIERVVYRREVSGARWGKDGSVEELIVVSAVHGDRIDEAVSAFWNVASSGARITFDDGNGKRSVTASIAGYAGHDRLMDADEALPLLPEKPTGSALPSFVFACYSEKYFGPSLRRVGSEPLVTTKALMAPEAYVVDAAARALGENATRRELRSQVVAAYAKWQRITPGVASTMFE